MIANSNGHNNNDHNAKSSTGSQKQVIQGSQHDTTKLRVYSHAIRCAKLRYFVLNATVSMLTRSQCQYEAGMFVMFTIIVYLVRCYHVLISTKDKEQLRRMRMAFVLQVFSHSELDLMVAL